MRRCLATLWVVGLLAGASACSGDDAAETPAATVATTERTTTTLSVEQEVEAAYLESWDVYADATLELDTTGLDAIYSGPALELVRDDIDALKARGARARFVVEHDYTIDVNDDAATVADNYLNHSVLLDGETRQPIEPDPNERVREEYLMSRIGGQWRVVEILR